MVRQYCAGSMHLNVFSSYRRCLKLLIISVVAVIISLATTASAEASSETSKITVYRDPSCSCCGGWVRHLAANGFQPKSVITSDMDALKQKLGVPQDLVSCHTAVINGYVIEGHVPADDIKRLLAEKPTVSGIAVPGMPLGTPGMESGNVREPFTVVPF